MASYSGLNKQQRIRCRDRVVQAALLAYNRKGNCHYTRGGRRWDGIANHRNARRGQYPYYTDCSAFVTWCLWNGLKLSFNKDDIVNKCAWKAGFTGTLIKNGKRVTKIGSVQRGDVMIYGQRGTNGSHAAIVVKVVKGVPYVISMGSESGPHYVRYNYRRDLMQIRRYI
jgi:hypothetical protein